MMSDGSVKLSKIMDSALVPLCGSTPSLIKAKPLPAYKYDNVNPENPWGRFLVLRGSPAGIRIRMIGLCRNKSVSHGVR